MRKKSIDEIHTLFRERLVRLLEREEIPMVAEHSLAAYEKRLIMRAWGEVLDELLEVYDDVREDYQKYYDGDQKMPFATVRHSLDKFFAEADELLAKIRRKLNGAEV